jgi:hypothetical protein
VGEDRRDMESADLYAQGGDFSQVLKDWEVRELFEMDFPVLPKNHRLGRIIEYSWRCSNIFSIGHFLNHYLKSYLYKNCFLYLLTIQQFSISCLKQL